MDDCRGVGYRLDRMELRLLRILRELEHVQKDPNPQRSLTLLKSVKGNPSLLFNASPS